MKITFNTEKTYPKSFQKLPKKETITVFYYKSYIFHQPKKFPSIWATFARKFVTNNFQKLPSLVTLKKRNPAEQKNQTWEEARNQ